MLSLIHISSQASIAKAAAFIKELFSAPVCDNSCAIAEEICILILDMMADRGLIRRDDGDFAPVSYTHLDVYKRQIHLLLVARCYMLLSSWTKNNMHPFAL